MSNYRSSYRLYTIVCVIDYNYNLKCEICDDLLYSWWKYVSIKKKEKLEKNWKNEKLGKGKINN